MNAAFLQKLIVIFSALLSARNSNASKRNGENGLLEFKLFFTSSNAKLVYLLSIKHVKNAKKCDKKDPSNLRKFAPMCGEEKICMNKLGSYYY